MQEHIEKVVPLIHENMLDAQAEQSRVYNCPAQPQGFWPEDRILLLVPSVTYKFLAFWQGPFTVAEQVGPVNYHLQKPG